MTIDGHPVPPIARPAVLDGFEGKWVALLGDAVVASADTSCDLVLALHQVNPGQRERAVVQFVRPSSDSFIVGAG